MDIIKTQNLTFTYPGASSPALREVSLTVKKGEFITVCGKSGCGKSTLLRLLKPIMSPAGEKAGEIYFDGADISLLSQRQQAEKIGFVTQNPDNQIVTDKTWHELAFGLENLGVPSDEIRVKVAEMASFFGIEDWFHKNTADLSGGQKQILNLASVMVMQPEVLLLDEPTAQLDPIAAKNFLETLSKINRETGTTVILTEHRLEEAFALSDRVVVMDDGKIIANEKPGEVGKILNSTGNDMFQALPVPVRVHFGAGGEGECPITVREGRKWLENVTVKEICFEKSQQLKGETAVKAKDIFVRYDRNLPDIISGVSLDIKKGEIYAVLGGNGAGKTTLISAIAGLIKPVGGRVSLGGKTTVLPQNPHMLFTAKTVQLELEEMGRNYAEVVKLCEISGLLRANPLDLSGGEAQKVALAKVLLTDPDILILDEPTKGLDACFKTQFGEIVKTLSREGKTVIMVSHDIEFCAKYADRCGLLFDGNIVSEGAPREFFSGKRFYTTAANRMAVDKIPDAVLAEDIILACGGKVPEEKNRDIGGIFPQENQEKKPDKKRKIRGADIVKSTVFAILFLALHFAPIDRSNTWFDVVLLTGEFVFLAVALTVFIPRAEMKISREKKKMSWKNIVSVVAVLVIVPLTIWFGLKYAGGRKYYMVSLLVILETMIPFFMLFEQRKPKARELVLVSVICAAAVVGREAFFMLPQFKPIAAIVIITGVCFGGETGFMAGTLSAFVSNFFFGQSVLTPWQMLALGLLGFLAGVIFRNGILKLTRLNLCMFGGISVIIVHGGILNAASLLMWQENPTAEMFALSYLAGFPFDVIYAVSTIFFLWVIAIPMIEKLERVKVKYNLMK